MTLRYRQGDITQEHVDAIVNAANSGLSGGGGVDGAIHRAGGPAIMDACRELRRTTHRAGLQTGQAVATTAGRLPARWVIHTVGPVYAAGLDQSDLLRCCYTTSLAVADELGASSVAFPLVSAGVYGWPIADAVQQAVTAISTATTAVTDVRLVLFDARAYAAASALLGPAAEL